MISIENNQFEKVAIPVVIADRYFLLEEGQDGKDIWTVFTFLEEKPVLEILRNQLQDNPLSTATTNPDGIVTVADKKTGSFLYRLKPGSKKSSVFGMMRGEEMEIRVTDYSIRVGTTLVQNLTGAGSILGMRVEADGSIIVGDEDMPPELKSLLNAC